MSTSIPYAAQCDYSYILDRELRSILIEAENEWLENAPETYGSDAINVWAEEIVPRLVSGNLRSIDQEDLELYCPNLLANVHGMSF